MKLLRSLLLAVLCVGAVLALPAAANPPVYKELQWETLVPKDWDPMKLFRETQPGAIAEGSANELRLMRQMREAWDNAPTVGALDGAQVKLPGYVVPIESMNGELKEFLLVPYFGACIHSPPPPANQIVYVVLDKPMKGLRAMDAVWASGTLKTARQDSSMGASGYRLTGASTVMYAPPRER